MNKETKRILDNLESLYDALDNINLYIDSLSEVKELIEDNAEVIHCSECKNRDTVHCPVRNSKEYVNDEWFCADGEGW